MGMNAQIGERIRKARKAKRLTQKELGEKIGRSGASIAYMEKGQRRISPDVLEMISVLTDHPISFFYEENRHVVNLSEHLHALQDQLKRIEEVVNDCEETRAIRQDVLQVKEQFANFYLGNQELKWKIILEQTSDYILTVDLTGQILATNKLFEGMAVADVVGRPVIAFILEEDQGLWTDSFNRAIASKGVVYYEVKGLGPDGQPNEWSGHFCPILEGDEVKEVLILARNLTQLRGL